MEKIPFTRLGLDKLKAELTNLKSVERQAVIRAIADAREHGDLSENAEYHAARERQSFIARAESCLHQKSKCASVSGPQNLNFFLPCCFSLSLRFFSFAFAFCPAAARA